MLRCIAGFGIISGVVVRMRAHPRGLRTPDGGHLRVVCPSPALPWLHLRRIAVLFFRRRRTVVSGAGHAFDIRLIPRNCRAATFKVQAR